MTNPRIAVIIPSFNRGSLLGETLQSVTSQTFQHWECVIVIGGDDNAVDVAREWSAKDPRIKFIEQKTSGPSEARNIGIRATTAPYIFPLDDDDLIDPTFFDRALRILESDTQIKVVTSKVMQFGHVERELPLAPYSYANLLMRNCIICCCLYRREDFERVGGYDVSFFVLEDWDFWISVLDGTSKVHRIDEYLYFYRRHASGSLVNSFVDSKKNYQDHIDRIYKKHIDKYFAIQGNPILLYRDYVILRAFQKKVSNTAVFRMLAWLRKKTKKASK